MAAGPPSRSRHGPRPGHRGGRPGAHRQLLPASDLGQTAQAQVLAQDGTVSAATRNWAGRPALFYTLPPGSTTPVRTSAGDRMLPDDLSEYGKYATVGDGAVTISTTAPTYLQGQVEQTFAWLLVIGVPVLLVLAGGTVWLARTMNDMLARLDDAAARQRRFVADASHELRSPLTAIRTGLEVGLAHPDRAP